jgi:4-diphosphocytidyl-2-C-methyl-D-erythritol kinase
MPSHVRSYSKINLGLAIGPPRPDGFHSLATLYQTLALYDVVSVTARRADRTRIQLTSNDPRVPRDARNTAWKMVERLLHRLRITATVNLRIQKNLPIQGGMGAGSANAAAALIGFERELGVRLPEQVRLELAAEVGSDVPLFLVGGSVLGTDRGQQVSAVPDVTLAGVTSISCVIALPEIGVSTPQAFRDWDALLAGQAGKQAEYHNETGGLQNFSGYGTLRKLSRTYAKVLPSAADMQQEEDEPSKSGTSGIFPKPSPHGSEQVAPKQAADLEWSRQDSPEKPQGLAREQHHTSSFENASGFENELVENSLLALVRAGIGNDFETVVFPQNPLFGDIKRLLMGSEQDGEAVYAALSGSGSALFGLYRSAFDAATAQRRLQQHGIKAIVTTTMPRPEYWNSMFAE